MGRKDFQSKKAMGGLPISVATPVFYYSGRVVVKDRTIFDICQKKIMKINRQTKITGDLVVLVPYRAIHVPKYHEWMSSEELQKLTASEPLSLEKEYEMQKSWADDEDKCTFIVLDKAKYEETNNEVDSMIGDTNIFMTDDTDATLAEIEIMIAETCYRKNGRGKESTLLMLKYGKEQLGVKQFHAKIGLDNIASIHMFQKIGFLEISRSEVFGEVTLAAISDDEAFVRYMKDHVGQYNVSDHYCISLCT